jgi:hypothetical protein
MTASHRRSSWVTLAVWVGIRFMLSTVSIAFVVIVNIGYLQRIPAEYPILAAKAKYGQLRQLHETAKVPENMFSFQIEDPK